MSNHILSTGRVGAIQGLGEPASEGEEGAFEWKQLSGSN